MAPTRFSLLNTLLCAVLVFSTNVFALSAVLGVDFGTEYIKAALVKPGSPIEIVLTKESRRKEAAAVAFKPPSNGAKKNSYPERLFGSDAIAVAPRFPADVFPNLKPLLGVIIDEEIVQEWAIRHPVVQLEKLMSRGTVQFTSAAFGEGIGPWQVEELLAMQLQSIQRNAEAAAGNDYSVRSAVLTVPPYYTMEEKRAIQTAADLAGLKVLSLISDGMAVGVHYATTRQFPNVKEGGKPEYHMVFDMGAGSTKATVLKFQANNVKDVGKFNKTVQEVQVLGSAWDRSLGGDALNALIIDDMLAQFIKSNGAQAAGVEFATVQRQGRTVAKLTKDAKKLREILSVNSKTQTSFEGLFDDIDFRYNINRADFETMATGHLGRAEEVFNRALLRANLDASDLTSVILHGGATRTPFIQKMLEESLGSAEKVRSSVNSDEAAVLGAGFRAAELSPSFRVKDIAASEGAHYASGMRWTGKNGKVQHQRLWTALSPVGGQAKEVTFTNVEDFPVAFYQQVEPEDLRDTKLMVTTNLTATVAELKEKHGCAEDDIRVKVSLKLKSENGEVVVMKAHAECETEVKPTFVDGVKNFLGFGNKEQKPLGEGEEAAPEESPEAAESSTSSTTSTTETSSSTTSSETEETSAEADAEPKKQTVSINLEYTVDKVGLPMMTADEIKSSKDRLKAFDTSDKERLAREEALNELEGFTYRAKELIEDEKFIAASTEEERKALETKADEAGDWIYGDGIDAEKDELKAKLKELKGIADPVLKRVAESSERPELLASLKDALNQTTEFVNNIRKQIDEYDEWHASSVAAAEASSTATEESAQPETTGDFDGLEDDEEPRARTMEDVIKEKGPVPPLYTKEDLDEVEAVYNSTMKWLAEMEEKQAALGPTDNAVLLVKDLKNKREKLDKVGLDLAMKGVKNFDKKKKPAGEEKPKKKKSKTSSTATASKPGVTINAGPKAETDEADNPERTVKFGEGENNFIKYSGKDSPTEEEMEELLKKIKFNTVPPEGDEHDEL